MDLLELDEEMLLTLVEVRQQSWTRQEQLLANVVDAVNAVGYNALVGPHADPKRLRASVRPPKPMPRPGVGDRRGATIGQLKLRVVSSGGGDG